MNDDVQKLIFNTLKIFVFGVILWLGFLFVNACGFTLTCNRAAFKIDRTPVPTLIPATLPEHSRFVPTSTITPTLPVSKTGTKTADENPDIARPSNPGGAGDAVNLTGDATAGSKVFASNCVACHGAQGVGGIANAGSTDGTVPALNPIDETLKNKDYKTFATNIDLFIQHGSTPAGANPIFRMPAWGDTNGLTQQQIADVIAYLISLNP
jgi:mono/diheme cytochrome c family protein